MRKSSLYSLIFILGTVATAALFASFTSGRPGMAAPAGHEMPEKVAAVIQKACMDCHSDDGSALARGKVNFSRWNELDPAKQVKKAQAICKELTKGDMPPKKWRANHPDSIPNGDDVAVVCNWARELK